VPVGVQRDTERRVDLSDSSRHHDRATRGVAVEDLQALSLREAGDRGQVVLGGAKLLGELRLRQTAPLGRRRLGVIGVVRNRRAIGAAAQDYGDLQGIGGIRRGEELGPRAWPEFAAFDASMIARDRGPGCRHVCSPPLGRVRAA
jgi:hypothetical protein